MRYGIANQTGQPGRDEVAKVLGTARAAGINFIDTARNYGDAEQLLGQLAGEDPYWVISTKLHGELGDLADCGAANLTRLLAAAAASLEISRHQLRRNQISIVLLHQMAHRTACSGQIWNLLRQERSRGTIGLLGISAAGPQEAVDALEDDEVEAIQVAANLADQRLFGSGFFERARSRGVLVIVRSTFLQGALLLPIERLPGYLAELCPFLEVIDEEARARGITRAELFFAHARHLGDIVLVGCETQQQLEENIRAWQAAKDLPDLAPKFADLAKQLPARVIEPWQWPR